MYKLFVFVASLLLFGCSDPVTPSITVDCDRSPTADGVTINCGGDTVVVGDNNEMGQGGATSAKLCDTEPFGAPGYWVRADGLETSITPVVLDPDGAVWFFALDSKLGRLASVSIIVNQYFDNPLVPANMAVESMSVAGEPSIVGAYVMDAPSIEPHHIEANLSGWEAAPTSALRVKFQAPLGPSPQAKLKLVAGPFVTLACD